MRALLLPAPGTPSTIAEGEAPDPGVGAGDVRVAVHACGLNPVDTQTMRHGVDAWTYPHILGLDGAGVVESVGTAVEGLAVGDRVAFHHELRRPGAMAELVSVDSRAVARVPDAVSFVDAAALPCAGMTAYQALHRRLHIAEGDTTLISAGAGGVGGFGVQLAHLAGATVIAVASARNHDHLRALGADHCIDYATQDVLATVRDLTDGRGVDGIVDSVSGAHASSLVPLLVHGGGLVSIAGRACADAVPPFTTAPSIHEIALGAAHSHGDDRAVADLSVMLQALLAMVHAGVLDPMVAETVSWDDAPAAWDRIVEGHVRGKIVAVTPGRES